MAESISTVRNELSGKLLSFHQDRNLGHLGSCLSALDVLTALFWGPLRPTDNFVLSKGHAASLLYLILNKKGLISEEDLAASCRDGSPLGAHPPFHPVVKHPWFGFGSGSLGYGIGLAAGVALAKKIRGLSEQVYVLVSEGDLNEGSSWEALHFAVQNRLSNLHVIFDHNKTQALGSSLQVFPFHHLETSLDALGWTVHRQDGHQLLKIKFAADDGRRPQFYIFDTVKNFGFEDQLSAVDAHYKNPARSPS